MITPLRRLRRLLVRHANSLPEERAKQWLDMHRLVTLHDEPELHSTLREHLKQVRRSVIGRNLLAIDLFQKTADLLAPIPIAPLKGIALLDSLYRDDIGLRPMADIDVLIPESQIESAVLRLERSGLAEDPGSRRTRHQRHHRVFVSPHGTLELHTRLGFRYGCQSTWQDLALVEQVVHERQAFVLTPPAELVHLVTHCYKHHLFSMLLWVHEILARSDELDPGARAEVTSVARRLRCRTALAAATEALRQALGDTVLPQVAIDELGASPLRLAMHRQLFAPVRVDPLVPFRRRSMLIEELRPHVLADSLADALLDFGRTMQIRFLIRWPY